MPANVANHRLVLSASALEFLTHTVESEHSEDESVRPAEISHSKILPGDWGVLGSRVTAKGVDLAAHCLGETVDNGSGDDFRATHFDADAHLHLCELWLERVMFRGQASLHVGQLACDSTGLASNFNRALAI